MDLFRMVLVLFSLGAMSGCGIAREIEFNNAMNNYHAAARLVHLGESRDKVLARLQPTQDELPGKLLRTPEQFIESNPNGGQTLTEIYYFRSGGSRNGINADDEFTPYI